MKWISYYEIERWTKINKRYKNKKIICVFLLEIKVKEWIYTTSILILDLVKVKENK